MSVQEKLSSLTHIELQMSSIEDAGVRVLAENCPELEHLDLAGARQITGKSLAALRQAARLTFCSLAGCIKIKVCVTPFTNLFADMLGCPVFPLCAVVVSAALGS